MNDISVQVLIFVIGATVGSFLNVCIHRMPRELSVVWPRSYCPQCKAPIPWYHNIPLVSFIQLRGRCFRCKRRIPVRYFIVELMNALGWLYLWTAYEASPQFVIGAVFISLMIVATMTDLETGLIPHKITGPGMVFGLCLSVVNTVSFPQGLWYHKLLASAVGLLGGGALLWITGWIGSVLFKKDAMGGGDVMLLAMAGAFLGFPKTLLVFMLAPFLALPYAVFHRFVKKHETIPYGPFLAAVAVLFFLKGEEIVGFLLKLYGV